MDAATLPVLAQFDDLRRCIEVFTDGAAEDQFLRFASYQEECRSQWESAVQEAQRLQKELDASLRNRADLESKLFLAKRLLEKEKKAKREAEKERKQLEEKLVTVANFIQNSETASMELREQLDLLKSILKKPKCVTIIQLDDKYQISVGAVNETVKNASSSFLSDLSVTHSEDDLLDTNSSRTWKIHRPSLPKNTGVFVGNKPTPSQVSPEWRLSGNILHQQDAKFNKLNQNDKICTTTKVSILENNDSVQVETKTEPMSTNQYLSLKSPNKKVSTTTLPPTTSEDNGSTDKCFDAINIQIHSPYRSQSPNINKLKGCGITPNLKNSLSLTLRAHNFSSKTFIISDNCTHCKKKMRFGSMGLKCKNCRLCVHIGCRDKLNITCIPSILTPPIGSLTQKGSTMFLTDYAPPIAPMIPTIIVNLVNEIESRGLSEVGLYRLSGSDREVKSLKETFLRGKKPQNLTNVDIHVLCSCIKDFLRCLREPLIPTDLWSDFSNAIENSNEEDIFKDLLRAVNRLPQANRDTLAYLLLHFQRVGECPEVKMPLENLARVFGPTILGYSSADPRPDQIMTEIRILIQVMDSLLKIPSEYWSQFTQFSDSEF